MPAGQYPSLMALGKAIDWSETQIVAHLNLLELLPDIQAELG